MKKTSQNIRRDNSILSTCPNLTCIGFEVTKNGIMRPIKNRAKK
jgi:hypothetical protein